MGFKVGQKFRVLDHVELQLDKYRNGDIFEVDSIDEFGSGYVWDKGCNDFLYPKEFDSPHLELINEPLEELLSRPDQWELEPLNEDEPEDEYTGGSVSYYKIPVDDPISGADPYVAEVIDMIRALDMNFVDGNQLKSLIRRAVARKYGLSKRGYIDGVYDAEKCVFFAELSLKDELKKREQGEK